ncbi:GNAT family N-acetyltransferase [Nocardioides marmoraquaticus]
MITWHDVAAESIGARDLYDALVLRADVFVVEQQCAYADPDGADLRAGVRHLLGRDGEVLAAYARVLPPDERYAAPRIGRVVVSPAARGGLGRVLMERSLAVCEEHHPGLAVELGGQAHLVGFYASLGFAPVGEVYDEDGIPHQWMRREAT